MNERRDAHRKYDKSLGPSSISKRLKGSNIWLKNIMKLWRIFRHWWLDWWLLLGVRPVRPEPPVGVLLMNNRGGAGGCWYKAPQPKSNIENSVVNSIGQFGYSNGRFSLWICDLPLVRLQALPAHTGTQWLPFHHRCSSVLGSECRKLILLSPFNISKCSQNHQSRLNYKLKYTKPPINARNTFIVVLRIECL